MTDDIHIELKQEDAEVLQAAIKDALNEYLYCDGDVVCLNKIKNSICFQLARKQNNEFKNG